MRGAPWAADRHPGTAEEEEEEEEEDGAEEQATSYTE